MLWHSWIISNADLVYLIFVNRDAFDFHVVNSPDSSANIPTASACGTYIPQLIKYSLAYLNYDNFFLDIPWLQLDRLFNHGFSNRN